MLPQNLLIFDILRNATAITVNDRTCNGEGDGISIPEPHNFDILADCRVFVHEGWYRYNPESPRTIVSVSEKGAWPTPNEVSLARGATPGRAGIHPGDQLNRYPGDSRL